MAVGSVLPLQRGMEVLAVAEAVGKVEDGISFSREVGVVTFLLQAD